MVRLKNDTLVVVADSEKALFLRNLTDHANPNLEVTDEESQNNPSDKEQSANRPGRMPDTGVGQRSALDDTDWHELAKDRFAKDLADKLYSEAHKGAFDRLVLVAAPHVLGVLRDELHAEVLAKLVMDIPKTLTNHPVDEIEKLVKKEMDAA
ncbi:host attachment protein [Pseudohalocynthiibacter aestuariivivens]|uniref:Host attachment family protein n=1 Tax=Roseovarius pelagicus TaxID=2980108 RepID=A0ABY6DE46_9RHOB|nr:MULTISPECIES: host attachment family protein [Rhodobacterales]QIE47054.1 host attachment protein [Pseudohalocynthiibacter aestuariivivens]UXX84396.1 host attachment family protein [Roseovarius pelagicus]